MFLFFFFFLKPTWSLVRHIQLNTTEDQTQKTKKSWKRKHWHNTEFHFFFFFSKQNCNIMTDVRKNCSRRTVAELYQKKIDRARSNHKKRGEEKIQDTTMQHNPNILLLLTLLLLLDPLKNTLYTLVRWRLRKQKMTHDQMPKTRSDKYMKGRVNNIILWTHKWTYKKEKQRVTKILVILSGVCWCVSVFFYFIFFLFFFYLLAHDTQASTMARSGCRRSALSDAFSCLDPLRHSRLAQRSAKDRRHQSQPTVCA